MQLPALHVRTRRTAGVAAAVLAVALLGTACQEAEASPAPRPTIPPLPTIALPTAAPGAPGGQIVLTCRQLGTSTRYLCDQTGVGPAPVTSTTAPPPSSTSASSSSSAPPPLDSSAPRPAPEDFPPPSAPSAPPSTTPYLPPPATTPVPGA